MENFDICIVGAGPAGCITALELQHLGYKVLLIEKTTFPRFHIGCSFSSGILHWLTTLKLTDLLSPALLHKHSMTSILWEDNTIINKYEQGLTVDRGIFDQLLLQHVISLGVHVIQSAMDVRIQEMPDTTWMIQVKKENTFFQFGARFLVEATGRKSLLKTGKKGYLPPLIATYAFLPQSFKHPIVEASAEGWFWGTPFKDVSLIAYFSHPTAVQKYKNSNNCYTAALQTFQTVSLLIPNNLQTFTCNASSYEDKSPIASNYIKVGDAAYTTDPISAQGVTKAIKSAVHASKVIHTLLQQPHMNEHAIAYYEQLIRRDVSQHGQWMNDFYGRQQIFQTPFWQQYSGRQTMDNTIDFHLHLEPQDLLMIHPDLNFVKSPVLGMRFIEVQNAVVKKREEEPYVFIDNLLIVPILKLIHQQTVFNSINLLYKHYPHVNPIYLLRYLINHQLIIKKEYEINEKTIDPTYFTDSYKEESLS
ncbi:NAD(P)/FAD-dependent oxidoreductase [Sphingobacterium anhuiense]|uniref:NAD(P)/FAD-dependent oxidoreductase n=1 Tax=Sphingobacterium anhuiense TaxID=493780 RepID=A0ABW5YVR9_9SPHI